MFDPNLYSIQIELSINAGEAFKAIDELEGRFNNIEAAFSAGMASALGNITTSTREINAQLGSMLVNTTAINDQYITQGQQLQETIANRQELAKMATEEFEQLEETEKKRIEEFDRLKLTEETAIRIADTLDRQLASITNMSTAGVRTSQTIQGMYTGLQNTSNATGEATNRAIELHTEFTKTLRVIDQSTRAIYANAIEIARMTEMAERFHTSNYRAYGTQHQLMAAVKETAAEYSVLNRVAAETYEQLMGIRVPIELLNEYTGLVTQANRITGAGTRELTAYIRIMSGASIQSRDTAYAISIMSAAQETFGLTVAEVNGLLIDNLDRLSLLEAAYGSDVPASMAIASAAIASMAKEFGGTTAAATKFNEMMGATGSQAMMLSGMLGSGFGSTMEGRFDAISSRFMDLGSQLYEAQRQAALTGESIDAQLINIEAVATASGGNMDMVVMFSNMVEKANGNIAQATKAFADYQAEIEATQKRQEQFAQAMNTLFIQVAKLGESIGALADPFIQFIARGMIPLIYAGERLVAGAVWIINSFIDMWVAIEKLIPPLAWARQTVEVLTAAVVLGVPVLYAMTNMFGVLSTAITWFAGASVTATGVFTALTTAIQAGLARTAAGFTGFMSMLSTGLATFGAAIRPVMVPLLALSGALLMAGAATWLFADAVSTIVAAGTGGLVALGALTVALAALGGGMVLLGAIAGNPIVATGMLTLGASLLMVGAAAWLMGAGVSMAADSMGEFLGVLSLESIGMLTALGTALSGLALAGLWIAPGLLLIGGSLLAISIPLILAGTGLQMLATGLAQMQNITIPDIGDKLTVFADQIAEGAWTLGLSVFPLTWAGTGLTNFASGLQTLSDIVLPDFGGRITTMAEDITGGAIALGDSLNPLTKAGEGLTQFATGLRSLSGFTTPDFGGKLEAMAIEITSGALALNRSVSPLTRAGDGLLRFATGLQKLSGFQMPELGNHFTTIARQLQEAANILSPSTRSLMRSGDGITSWAEGLAGLQDLEIQSVGEELVGLANNMTVSANILQLGSDGIRSGAATLRIAGTDLGGASQAFGTGVKAFATASHDLPVSTRRLETAVPIIDLFTLSMERLSVTSFDNLVTSITALNGAVTSLSQNMTPMQSIAGQLEVASAALSSPVTALTTQVDDIISQVERLIEAESQIREIGGDMATAIHQPNNDAQAPNEMRTIEKVTEAVNAIVNVSQDNSEMVELLAKLVSLTEQQMNKSTHQSFFQNEAGKQADSDKLIAAGVDI